MASVTAHSIWMSPPLATASPRFEMNEIWQIGGTTVCWMLFHLM